MTTHTISASLLASVTAAPEAFVTIHDEYDRHISGTKVHHLAWEYGVHIAAIDDYTSRIAIFDEDRLPLVTAVIDIYDDEAAAVEVLAFVAMVAPRTPVATTAQLQALVSAYPAFKASADLPLMRQATSADLRLTAMLLQNLVAGGTIAAFFAPTVGSRKAPSTTVTARMGGSAAVAQAVGEAYLAAAAVAA